MILGIDPSIRSAGYVILDLDGKFVKEFLCSSTSSVSYPEVMVQNLDMLNYIFTHFQITQVGIESPAFAAKSSTRDVLSGLFWVLVTEVFKRELKQQHIAPSQWRNVPRGEDLKEVMFQRLPTELKETFVGYKKSKYDLSDAYHIAKYTLTGVRQ